MQAMQEALYRGKPGEAHESLDMRTLRRRLFWDLLFEAFLTE